MKQIRKSSFPTVVTIGNFDGLHRGHLALIRKTKSLAEKHALKSLVCSFDCNTKGAELIFPQKQLKSALKELSVDYFSLLPFFREIIGLSCETFVKEYLCNRFQAKFVVVGEDFRFGQNRCGDIVTLTELGKQFGFQVIPVKMQYAGKRILSSTYIRELIQAGKIKQANRYLFRPFFIEGVVGTGFSLGNQLLEIPTANIPVQKSCVSLPFGVYKTITDIDGISYQSITNVGYAPTYRKKTPTMETHLFDFSGNLYGKRIRVTFLQYIRKERKFSSMETLKKQIQKDIASCKR